MGYNSPFSSPATEFRLRHEDVACCKVYDLLRSKHQNLKMISGGFPISLAYPEIGSLTDRVFECDCCDIISLEVKYSVHAPT